jgi:hypothetical protein
MAGPMARLLRRFQRLNNAFVAHPIGSLSKCFDLPLYS